jgi:hypothetical protein
MVLVPLLNPKFAIGLAAKACELRVRGTSVPLLPSTRPAKSVKPKALLEGRDPMGQFLMVFVLLIAAAGVGYVAGHSSTRPVPAAAASDKPATPAPAAPKVIPANPVTDVTPPSSQ